MTEQELICARCGRLLRPGRGVYYVVQIHAYADPTPIVTVSDDPALDHRAEMERLLHELADVSAQEALDQVYRSLVLHLCVRCYQVWIEDPTSKSS